MEISLWLLSDNVRQGLKSDETPTVAPLQVNHWLDVEVMKKTEEFLQVFPETHPARKLYWPEC